jgi:two-component system cell cycle sensor histidine kinase/response regulator CckA
MTELPELVDGQHHRTDRSEKDSHQRWYVLVTKAAAIFSLGLGLMVMTGWLAHITALLQITPTSVPTMFNTALGFIFCGLALWAFVFGRRRIALVSGGVATGIGLLTLLQYSFNLDFGIDELFIRDFIRVETSHPGRMSPNAAICFTLAGAALVIASWRARCDKRSAIIGILSATVVALGIVAFVGHWLAIPTAYGWGQFTRLSIQASIGFIALGLGIFAHAWRESVAAREGTPKWLPAIVGIGVATVAVLQWAALNGRESASLRETIRLHTKQVKDQVGEQTTELLVDLEQMAKRWADKGGTSKDEWEADAQYYVLDDPSYQAVEWVDPSLHVRWVVPLKGNEAAQDLFLGFDENRREALEKARSERKIALTRPVELVRGEKGFLVLVPVFSGEKFYGFNVGVLRSQKLLDLILANVATDCGISISSAGEQLYVRGEAGKRYASQWGQEASINLYGTVWRIKVWPTPKLLATHDTRVGEAILVAGLLMAFLLAATVALAQRARRRARELQREIAERERMGSQLDLQGSALESAANGIVITDTEGKILWSNKAFSKLTGYELSETVGKRTSILKSGRHDEASYKDLWQTITSGRVWHGEIINRRKDGSLYTEEQTITPVAARDGKITHYIAIKQDVTERKRSEERLREQAEMLDHAHDAIVIRNFDDQRIVFWNSAAEHLYGWSASEAIGRPIGELLYVDPKERAEALKILMDTGEFRGEVSQVTKDDRKLIGDVRVTIVRNPDGTPRSVLMINTDVTEQKKLEMQLLRAQRLESIGTLASGVAHDLNNILTPILMCAETLRRDLSDEDRQSAISLIKESAQRGAGVVKQVLTFARGVEGERVLIKPSHLIEEMIDIARSTFPKFIEITGRYPEDLWTIQGDPTQLHQVLLNLAVNARDAMPGGGSLTLAAENFTIDENYAAMAPDAKVGSYVVVCVSDSGIGMPQETIDKIFDPFFTTKELGKGTGLGLSTTLGIVKSHGGFISVDSEVGKGTIFKIFLPAEVSDQSLRSSETRVAPAQGNGELVFVVDDEENILRATRTVLEQNNYRVVSASDGVEALAVFAQQMQAIRVVLTDISMPRMDGVAAVRALRKMKPDVPIIAFTGQEQQARLNELQAMNVNNCLIKPFNTEDLLAVIHTWVGTGNEVEAK